MKPENLTNREYIAAMILQGLLAGSDENYNYRGDHRAAALDAIKYTDALILALSENELPSNKHPG